MRRKAFTLIELLVVIAIIGLLVSILVPSISKAQRLAKQAACGSNLNGLGKALAMYQNMNKDRYPFISNVYGPSPRNEVNAATFMVYDAPLMDCSGTSSVFDLDNDNVNSGKDLNMVENLNLLIKSSLVGNWRMFRCPQVSSQIMDRSGFTTGKGQYGFYTPAGMFIDYAFHNGYTYTKDGKLNGAKKQNGAPLTARMASNFVVLADQPGDSIDPYGGGGTNVEGIPGKGLGYNHGDETVEMLTIGGSVQAKDTILAGVNDNNIYGVDMEAVDPATGVSNVTKAAPTFPGTAIVPEDSVLVKAAVPSATP